MPASAATEITRARGALAFQNSEKVTPLAKPDLVGYS
jgi:hypothetical protein